VVGLPKQSIHKELPGLATNYDIVIIDGPPRVYEVVKSAVMASDLVVVPVQPSPYDVWAAKEIVDNIKEASIYKPLLKKAFVISRNVVNSAIGRDVVAALAEYPIPVLETVICQRVIFAESATQGLTVFDLDEDCQASQEIDLLARELGSWLQ
jgi:chromosome partitioning protein